jgi:hypothetical protein
MRISSVLSSRILSPREEGTKYLGELRKEVRHNAIFIHLLVADSKSEIMQLK